VPIVDRGNQKDWRGLRVLRKTYCPAVLVELDYLSNPAAEARLANRGFQKRMAQALGDGIESFLKARRGPAS
jgi:N-acetylmuramoyl-L-alanine amidase